MARQAEPLDLLREVLDHELVDAAGVPCGMVDDLEFEDTGDGPALAALVCGPGAWGERLPALLRLPARWLFGRRRVRIAWEEVADIGEVIRLKRSARDLGLGETDRKVQAWIARLPGS